MVTVDKDMTFEVVACNREDFGGAELLIVTALNEDKSIYADIIWRRDLSLDSVENRFSVGQKFTSDNNRPVIDGVALTDYSLKFHENK